MSQSKFIFNTAFKNFKCANINSGSVTLIRLGSNPINSNSQKFHSNSEILIKPITNKPITEPLSDLQNLTINKRKKIRTIDDFELDGVLCLSFFQLTFTKIYFYIRLQTI